MTRIHFSIKNISDKLLLAAFFFCSLFSCKKEAAVPDVAPVFHLLTAAETGLDFTNEIHQSDTFNVMEYMYFYNGGGVAVGDFNQDGLQDVYFTKNMGENALYLNEGDLNFKDITKESGAGGGSNSWSSGVTVVDINLDGLLDIYVSQVGVYTALKGHNLLFVCEGIKDGIPVFKEKSKEYGLDLMCFGTQAAFFDYDLDGDLDMYQLCHSIHDNGTFGGRKDFMNKPHPYAGDKIFRNEKGKFTDVTEQTGILSSVIGYGLGIVTGDMNQDGWPDIYIGNDFHENDYLYINQKNGTFKEVLTEQIRHTSRFSMGVEMLDINNDGWTDLMSLDMLPRDPYILKTSLAEDGFDTYRYKQRQGYNDQFSRNALQLNNGNQTFSEIGLFADVYATDWSWAVLGADFDLDGQQDMFISNGIKRRMNDIDYINHRNEDNMDAQLGKDAPDTWDAVVTSMPQIKLPNVFFRNRSDLTFEENKGFVQNDLASYSNGAAYADFDNDGDLDVVVNNLEDAAFLYENLTNPNPTVETQFIASPEDNGAADGQQTQKFASLRLELKGAPQNPFAIGARAQIFKKDGERFQVENYPTRGFQSAVQSGLFLGIGDTNSVDSIVLIWPDWRRQKLEGLAYNQTHTIEWNADLPKANAKDFIIGKNVQTADIQLITKGGGFDYVHDENDFVDFNREPLIPRMVSCEGPALAVGDVNGDGFDDVFFGSSKWERSALFFQKIDGTFSNRTSSLIIQDSLFEDVDAVFFDFEKDGDLDLLIAAGGNEFGEKNEPCRQRIFLNDGTGNFSKKYYLPDTYLTASCVAVGDNDGDGLEDIFVGGRAVPWEYGRIPESFVFKNNGDRTVTKIPEFSGKLGFVKDAHWIDMDGDKKDELILANEWGRIMIFALSKSGMAEKEQLMHELPALQSFGGLGWWNFVLPYDFDGDGDIDILAGNMGENTKLKPSVEQPLKMYVNDFDDDGKIEQLLTYYLEGKEIPFATHAELTKRLVKLKKKYLLSKDLAKADLADLFGKKKLDAADVFMANNFSSMYFENDGAGNFVAHRLPMELQFSAMMAAEVIETKDGTSQVLIGGNFHENNIEMGKYDADYGHVLTIEKDGNMSVLPLKTPIKGQIRNISKVNIGGKKRFVAVRNGALAVVLGNPE